MGAKQARAQGGAGGDRRTALVVLLAVSALVVAVVLGLAAGSERVGGDDAPTPGEVDPAALEPRPGSGPRAPDFDLAAFEGEGRVTADEFAGTPLVLNFWGSWCPPCVEEMPAFERVHQRYEGTVAFLGVNLQDDPEFAASLVERTGVTYPLATDEGEFFREVEGRGMPLTLFITADGHEVHRVEGNAAMSEEELEGLILEHLLRER